MTALYLVAWVVTSALAGITQVPSDGSPSQVPLRLARDLRSPTGVARVAIFWVPREIHTYSALTTAELERSPLCEIRIDLRLLPPKRLAEALSRTAVVPSDASTDLRWAIVFWYHDGRREAVYLDGFGRLGQINSTKVEVKADALLQYLEGIGGALGY